MNELLHVLRALIFVEAGSYVLILVEKDFIYQAFFVVILAIGEEVCIVSFLVILGLVIPNFPRSRDIVVDVLCVPERLTQLVMNLETKDEWPVHKLRLILVLDQLSL